MPLPKASCSICSKAFEIKFRYQVREEQGRFHHCCSQLCLQSSLSASTDSTCSVCSKAFALEYPFQVSVTDERRLYFCTTTCLQRGSQLRAHSPIGKPRRVAVFNHKGGTGKTTTAVNLAAALAERGERVLLIDADGQGNVGTSLGIVGEYSLYHALVVGTAVEQAVVPVRPNLDVLTSNELLAAAELYLATQPNRDRVMREQLGRACAGYDRVIIDCAPALSLMNQNVLVLADSCLLPVACEYLSLVGVRKMLATLRQIRQALGHRVELLGVVPTFYDTRNRMCRESLHALRESFQDRCFHPIRVNTRLKEAPSARQTIFEYAPHSHGAQDYLQLADTIEQLTLEQTKRRASVPCAPQSAPAPVQAEQP